MRPALAANSGTRGKIQHRCCQGRMASSWSQRQTVLSLMEATIPERQASRATSATLSRDSGNPRVASSSHGRAFTWTMTSGGKSPGSARALALLQASQAFFEEPLAPLADDLPSGVEAAGLEARLRHVNVPPRMVYVDASRPERVEGLTRNKFAAMVQGVRERALTLGLIDEVTWKPSHHGAETPGRAGGVLSRGSGRADRESSQRQLCSDPLPNVVSVVRYLPGREGALGRREDRAPPGDVEFSSSREVWTTEWARSGCTRIAQVRYATSRITGAGRGLGTFRRARRGCRWASRAAFRGRGFREPPVISAARSARARSPVFVSCERRQSGQPDRPAWRRRESGQPIGGPAGVRREVGNRRSSRTLARGVARKARQEPQTRGGAV